jgi:hypothetical protein
MMRHRLWRWHGIGFFSDRWRHVDGVAAARLSAVPSAAIPSAAAVPAAVAVVAVILDRA